MQLTERPIDFNYSYRMACECGRATTVSAETYHREEGRQARVPCDYCSRTIHFGPAVAALRDTDDRALSNAALSRFAWYHTSTWGDWPSPDHPARVEAKMRATMPANDPIFGPVEGHIHRETTKALHVGTYEAAIENMLRQMRDQANARAQFFLYRVAVDIDPTRLNDGFRDENHEQAAQLSFDDLDAADLDAVRYLNVREAMGTLSLALRPRCIRAVQCVSLPINGAAEPNSPELDALLTVSQRELGRLPAARSPRGRDWRSRLHDEGDMRRYEVWERLDAALAEHHLRDISPVVRDEFGGAMARNRELAVAEYARQFAELGALLSRAPLVLAEVDRQPWRMRS